MTTGFASVRADVTTELRLFGSDVDSRLHTFEAMVERNLNRQLRWVVGTMIASYAVIAALAGIWR